MKGRHEMLENLILRYLKPYVFSIRDAHVYVHWEHVGFIRKLLDCYNYEHIKVSVLERNVPDTRHDMLV